LIIAIDHLRGVVLKRLEDGQLAVTTAQHVESGFKLRCGAMAAAVRNPAFGF